MGAGGGVDLRDSTRRARPPVRPTPARCYDQPVRFEIKEEACYVDSDEEEMAEARILWELVDLKAVLRCRVPAEGAGLGLASTSCTPTKATSLPSLPGESPDSLKDYASQLEAGKAFKTRFLNATFLARLRPQTANRKTLPGEPQPALPQLLRKTEEPTAGLQNA